MMTSVATEKGKIMNRWIDGEWLLNFFEPYPNDYQTPLGSLRACVDDAPSIDIVRCGECKYWLDGSGLCKHWSKLYGSVLTKADDFCSYGEREGE